MKRPVLTLRRRPWGDWTGADYDSLDVLLRLGASAPAARVNRARRARPVRRAVRTALRHLRSSTSTTAPKEQTV